MGKEEKELGYEWRENNRVSLFRLAVQLEFCNRTISVLLKHNTDRQPCVIYLAMADKYILFKEDIMLEMCVACNKDK